MSELPAPAAPTDLVPVDAIRADEHPVAVYLAGLSAGSRRSMLGALDTVAQLGLGSENATAWDVPWHRLRFQHSRL